MIQREQQRYSDIKYDLEQDLEQCKKKQAKLENVSIFLGKGLSFKILYIFFFYHHAMFILYNVKNRGAAEPGETSSAVGGEQMPQQNFKFF